MQVSENVFTRKLGTLINSILGNSVTKKEPGLLETPALFLRIASNKVVA